MIGLKPTGITGRQRRKGPSHLRRESLGKDRGQTYHIVAPLTERRQADWKYIEPIIQVFAEGALLGRCGKIPIGRGQHPHVDFLGPRTADGIEFSILEHPQQLRL